MFGYVIPNYKELKVREVDEYRAWYCGLCQLLRKKYGFLGQLSLTYDMTFLGLLLSGLYDTEVKRAQKRCVVHPVHKHEMHQSTYLEYAADMNVLLAYAKCQDDWKDDHNLWKATYGILLKKAGERVTSLYPVQAEQINRNLQALSKVEQSKSGNLDEAAGLFGAICGCLFAYTAGEWQEDLQRMGFFLGKFIYLLDALDDLDSDEKKDSYNPFRYVVNSEDRPIEDWAKSILEMMMAECCRCFERLPVIENVEIIRNILYSGVWCRYEQIALARKGETTDK